MKSQKSIKALKREFKEDQERRETRAREVTRRAKLKAEREARDQLRAMSKTEKRLKDLWQKALERTKK